MAQAWFGTAATSRFQDMVDFNGALTIRIDRRFIREMEQAGGAPTVALQRHLLYARLRVARWERYGRTYPLDGDEPLSLRDEREAAA